MNMILVLSLVMLWAATALIVLVLFGYPLLLTILGWMSGGGQALKRDTESIASVSLLVAVRNGKSLIEEKLVNSLSLRCSGASVDVVVVSDGSTDGTDDILVLASNCRVKTLFLEGHRGKAAALNAGMPHCRGDIVVFSDTDAILETHALTKLAQHFAAGSVGGVCGRRVIKRETAGLREAQQRYINFDSSIKRLESRLGSITSNDGKLYAVRRQLLVPIPEGVTDDLFSAISVVGQGYRFLFEPNAVAFVPLPSRSAAHEISRRRRIVSRSLRGIWLNRHILNPFRYGLYSVGLLINKVFRRALPLFLVAICVCSLILSLAFTWAAILVVSQGLMLAVALYYPLGLSCGFKEGVLRKVSALAWYVLVGMWGSLLGMWDFTIGKTVSKWDPIKNG